MFTHDERYNSRNQLKQITFTDCWIQTQITMWMSMVAMSAKSKACENTTMGERDLECSTEPLLRQIMLVFFFYNCFVPLGFLSWKNIVKPAATELHYTMYGACWVFQCFHNPSNSDVDYRIFNVCMWSFCMHIQMGPWCTVSPEELLRGIESAQNLTSGKLVHKV